MKTLKHGIAVCLLIVSAIQFIAPRLYAADDQVVKDALEQVKSELIAELKSRGHEGLADQLGGVNPEKIGDFLGSAAGGDFDRAFNIAGSSTANYLNDKFKEQLDAKLGEWIQPDSPAAVIGKYIPWDSAQAKQIAISAIGGEFSKAGEQLSAMVQTKGRENLEQMSKDIVAHGIDWVLKPTVGAGAGQLFIKTVELELAAIEWFKKWSVDYFTKEVREQYIAYRNQGMTPGKAFERLHNETLFTMGAFLRPPFNGEKSKAIEYFEAKYGLGKGITEDSIRQNASAAAQKLASSLAAELRKRKEESDRKLKQELLQIFARVAQNNAEIKELIAKAKKARDNIDAIDAETEKLGAFWKKNKQVLDPARMEARRRAIEEKIAGLDRQAAAPALETCSRVDAWTKQVEQALDDMDATFERIREIGKEAQEIAGKICGNKDDKAAARQGMLALKKRFGLVGALRRDAAAKKAGAAARMDELAELKTAVRSLLDKQREVSSALDQIDKWQKLLDAVQQNIDTPAKTVDSLYAEIRRTIDDPVFDRFKGERGSIRYTLLGEATKARKDFDEQKAEAEAGLRELAKSLGGFDAVRHKLDQQKQKLDQGLGECRRLQDLDLTQDRSRIREMEEKDARYVEGFKKVNEKAKTCAGDLGDISSDALKEARKWLERARERGGTVIDDFMTADAAKSDLAAMAASAGAVLSRVSLPAADAPGLIAACSQARAQAAQLQGEIRAAISASSGHYAILKQGYETAANARKSACEKASAASGATDAEACRQAAAGAAAHAAAARRAAQSAVSAAEKMRSLYAGARAKSGIRALDELLRKVPSAIQSLKDQAAGADDQLSGIDGASIDEKRRQAKAAAENAGEAARKVSEMVGVIRGLLAGIGPPLAAEAEKIRGEAESVKEIAGRRSREAAKAAAEADAAGKKAAAALSDAETKIKALSAMIDSLGQCRGGDLGGGLNELRTNSDMGEVFGPAARAEAENATICAGGAAETCKSLQEAGCRSDTDCPSGYVCNPKSGKCVSPFDSGYDDYADTMGQREDGRSQDRADQVAADQGSAGTRTGFTSDDMDRDLASAQDAVAGKCKKDSQCPPGFVCRDGLCVEKPPGCTDKDDCPPGHECRDGKCVKVSGCASDADCPKGQVCKDGRCVDEAPAQPASLAVSPANKAVVLNETVNLKAVYTDTDGSTRDVTAEAAWNPSASFSRGEIGVYTVTASYQGLSAASRITVVQEKGMDDITVNKKKVTVTFWDHGREDGDMIDILINGKVVFPGITLTNAHQSRTITLEADIIVVGFKALNVGSISPNTATVTFSSVTAGKETQVYELKKDQAANMNVTYKP